jgi:hypothetical protein
MPDNAVLSKPLCASTVAEKRNRSQPLTAGAMEAIVEALFLFLCYKNIYII